MPIYKENGSEAKLNAEKVQNHYSFCVWLKAELNRGNQLSDIELGHMGMVDSAQLLKKIVERFKEHVHV